MWSSQKDGYSEGIRMKYHIENAIKFIKNNAFMILVIMIYAILISSFLLDQGVMCGDEIKHRFKSFYGIREFFKTFVSEQVYEKGRALAAIPTTIFLYVGFASPNRFYERIMATIAIFLCIIIAAYFVKKLFKNNFLTMIYAILLMSFIPISFEHSIPNAFATVYCIPFSFLLLSWIVYLDYLQTSSVKKLILSCVLFFIPLVSYEIFVTYTPLYLLLAFYKSKETQFSKRVKDAIKKFIVPLLCAIVFLIMYVVVRKIFGSAYDGNQIGSFTIIGMLQIIKQLSISSFPGYFLFNDKYHYLYQIYADTKEQGFWKTILENVSVIIFLLVVLLGIIFVQIRKMKSEIKPGIGRNVLVLISAIVFVVLPTLPLSVSAMYQGNVTDSNFIQLPVNFFSYFASCFFVAFFISIVKSKKSRCFNVLLCCVLVLVVIGMFGVQSMNSVFVKQQKSNYERMEEIEQLLDTQVFHLFEDTQIYSEDIYKTMNLLAFRDGYWDTFAQKNQCRVGFTKDISQSEYQLYFTDDSYFQLVHDENVIVFIPQDDMRSKIYLQCEDDYKNVELDNNAVFTDGKYKVYYFKQNQEGVVQMNPGGIVLAY